MIERYSKHYCVFDDIICLREHFFFPYYEKLYLEPCNNVFDFHIPTTAEQLVQTLKF